MAIYLDAEQLYAYVEALFELIAEMDAGAADSVLASRLVIRLRCTEPEAEITINGRQRPLETTYGPSRLRPTLDIELTADTLHAITLGELGLRKALAEGLLEVRGPIWKAKALADLFYQGQELYRQVLEERGWPGRPEE
jgi:3-methyladenine DNA glycosylase Mpg